MRTRFNTETLEYSDMRIRKHPTTKGKWIGYMYWYDADGERHQVSKTAKSRTKKGAKEELKPWEARLRREAEIRRMTGDSNVTVEEVISSFLKEQLEKGFLEQSTYYAQTCACKKNVFPYIGDYCFTGVDYVVIDKWLADLNARGLKQGTIHTVYAIVNKTYNHYQFIQQVKYNPCDHVKKPRKGSKRITYMDTDQIDSLLSHLNEDYEQGDYFWTAINLAILGGLRRGEICGLRFHNVDMTRKVIEIDTAIGVTGEGTYTKEPKNDSSKRTFFMPEQLVSVLQKRMDYVRRQYGTIDGSWFVIGDTISYKPPTTLAKEVARFVSKHGIVDHYGNAVTLHTLRHDLASRSVKNNVDVASLSNMLGHASKAMTLDTYSHENPDAMRAAAEKISNAFEMNYSAID